MRLQGDVARHVGLEVLHAFAEVLRGFFEGAVLQEPGKQQIAGLQVGIARLLVFFKTRQQVRGLMSRRVAATTRNSVVRDRSGRRS